VLLQVAAAHPGASPAQIVLAWLWAQGIPSNPRTMNATHMRDNLSALSIQLTAAEMAALSSRPIDYCSVDSDFYECVPAPGFAAPQSPFQVRRA
jgi:diketogulonate reductase-like aldo/keto reductase